MRNMILAAGAACVLAASAQATVVETLPGGDWTSPISENYGSNLAIPPGSAAITTTVAKDGDGSIELLGNRARMKLGTLYPNAAAASFGLLSDFTALTMDWRIATGSTTNYNADYTPALRFHIWDAVNGRKELIWEGAYNGTYGNTLRDTWYTSLATDKFYITGGNVNDGKTIAEWGTLLAADVVVKGISVGHGGGAGDNYHAFVDNVTAARKDGTSTTYNFNVNPTPLAGAVPEPASWAMMVGGFGLIGGAMRRRRVAVRFA